MKIDNAISKISMRSQYKATFEGACMHLVALWLISLARHAFGVRSIYLVALWLDNKAIFRDVICIFLAIFY